MQGVKTKFVLRVKIDVIKEPSCGQGVRTGQRERADFQGRGGDAAMDRSGGIGGGGHGLDGTSAREISAMACRQYQRTAPDMGG